MTTPQSPSTSTSADLLHQYSEWLDGEEMILPESDQDARSHDDLVAEFLASQDITHVHFGGPMTTPMDYTCAVHKHDSWVPIQSHHIWPLGMGGPDTKENRVTVCANGHYAIHEYLRQLILLGDGKDGIRWEYARHFNALVRNYAKKGWERAGSPRKGATHSEGASE